MKALRNILTKLLNVLAGLSLIAMVALTCWQVFTRYIVQNPSSWSEELVSYLFAWASLLGASLITGERGHMNIPVLVERMGMGAQKFFGILGEVIAFAFSCDYPGIRRRADQPAGHGTDDLFPGRGSGYLLCGASFVRCAEHDLHRAEYRGYQQRKFRRE